MQLLREEIEMAKSTPTLVKRSICHPKSPELMNQRKVALTEHKGKRPAHVMFQSIKSTTLFRDGNKHTIRQSGPSHTR